MANNVTKLILCAFLVLIVLGNAMAQPSWPSSNYLALTLARGPLISRTAALAIAATLLRERWNADHASLQGNLDAEDQGETWRVLGSATDDPSGRFCMIIRKADGLVLDIGIFGGPGGVPE